MDQTGRRKKTVWKPGNYVLVVFSIVKRLQAVLRKSHFGEMMTIPI